ncbi:hypothetical protein V1502_13300 [Bacillus sp. SCS-153A]
MEKYYCERCRRLFEKDGMCDKCLLTTKKITIHNLFQKPIKEDK